MVTTLSTIQIILWGLVLAWLGACAVYDLRSRQVPGWLTIPPLILAAVGQLFQENWQLVLLLVVLVLISDLPATRWRIPLAGLAAVLTLSISGASELFSAELAIFTVWALWELGASGGADTKIIITLVLLFGNGLVFLPIIFVGGIQGLFGLATRQKTIPYTVSITLGAAAWFWMTAGH